MRVSQALVLLAIAAAPVAALADNINVSTGTGTTGYMVTPPSGPTVTAVETTPPYPSWVLISGASWVAPSSTDGTGNAAAGVYVYTTTFTLNTTSNLSGSFASDNDGSVSLSGTTIVGTDSLGSNTPADSFSTPTSFTADDLGPGTYTLTFDINNYGGAAGSPTGLIVGANTSTVPEPSSLALLGTGLLSAAGIARRRLFSR